MSSGLTQQALLRHRWSLAGPAATQVVGAGVISVMVMAVHSISSSLTLAGQQAPAVAHAVEFLNIFRGNARFLSIITVGVTMNLAMSQQMRDIALLRSIGACPAQVRWCLVRQAVVVAVPASIIGFVLAIPVCAIWLRLLTGHGVLPGAVRFHPDPAALVSALAAVVITSAIGTMVAVLRPSRLAPARAVTAALGGARPIGRGRIDVGVALVLGGIVLSVVLSQLSATVADAAGIFILLGESVGVGLLGPLILHGVTQVLSPCAGDGTGRLALDNINAMSRSLSGALIPLVLSISFATIQNGMLATAARATGDADTMDRWMTFGGTASTVLFAAVAALNCLITVNVGRGRDLATMTLSGGSRRTLLCISTVEALVFAATGLLIAGAISAVTLIPIAHASYHLWIPYLPLWSMAVGALAVIGLVGSGMVGTAAILTRRNPVHVLRVDA